MQARRLLAEFIGTALLLAAVMGSGTMGVMLSAGQCGLARQRVGNGRRKRLLRQPAVIRARPLTRTFAGIPPADVGGSVLAQAAGALLALRVASKLAGTEDLSRRRRRYATKPRVCY